MISQEPLPDLGRHVDAGVFCQILELDEDGTYHFSRPLVASFFEQAKKTLSLMSSTLAFTHCDDAKLFELGHFLHSSATALGFIRIKYTSQIIWETAQKITAGRTAGPDEKPRIRTVVEALKMLEVEVEELRVHMDAFFKRHQPQCSQQ